MRAMHVTIRGDIGDAIDLARVLVEPAEGYGSFDLRFMGWLDSEGRRTMMPTAEAAYAYTFWRSARRGRYTLATAQPGRQRAELRFGLFGGVA